MFLLLMLVSVTNVIVSNVTPISALVGLQLEMNIHSVNFQSFCVIESFSTVLALILFLIIWSVHVSNVSLQSVFKEIFSTKWTWVLL